MLLLRIGCKYIDCLFMLTQLMFHFYIHISLCLHCDFPDGHSINTRSTRCTWWRVHNTLPKRCTQNFDRKWKMPKFCKNSVYTNLIFLHKNRMQDGYTWQAVHHVTTQISPKFHNVYKLGRLGQPPGGCKHAFYVQKT